MKKLVFLCHGAGNGGAERVITTLASEFANKQYEVFLFTTNEDNNDYVINSKWCSMHDVWMYLICMFFGSTIYDFEGHISYRQHDNNVMGAYKKKDLGLYIERIKRVLDRSQQPKFKNALNFYECYGEYLSEKDREKVLEIVNYKKSFSNWMKLLFDKDLKATPFSKDFRNRLLILFRLL